jgi:hypothetical protein
MPLTQCPHCRSQIQIPDVRTDSVGTCQYCRKNIWLYKCFSCMKVTAFLPTLPRPTRCPRCHTMVRSGKPLALPKRKRIVIEIFDSPGTGNVANAKNIWNALRHRYTVHIQVSGNESAMAKVFNEAYVAAEPRGDYDLLIVPGLERIMAGQIKTRLIKVPPLTMNLPPPFCNHLFCDPFLREKGSDKRLSLEMSLPFLPLTRNWRQIQKVEDYKGMKAKYFPDVDKSNIFFIVTYLGLAGKKTDAFKNCDEHIIILNFGNHQLEATGTNNVVSVKCERLSMVEFEECLLQCTTIYPAITDGGNTVGTIQSLELPYYDLSMKRVLTSSQVAFLNDGLCDMGLFRILNSRQNNMEAFQIVERKTQAYYDANRQARQQGRGATILFLVEEVLK